jgi:4-amino-4-deoxy-L-arabinose transferase-like glycosyltransferase
MHLTLSSKLENRMLIAIIVVSILLRVGSSFYMGNKVEAFPGVYDQMSYDNLARRILTGHGYSFEQNWWPDTAANAPTAHWSFLYPLFLAFIYWIFGFNPLVARIIQSILAGIIFPLLVYRLANRRFGSIIGLVAAMISAIYIYFFYYSASLMTETLFIIGILWSFDIAIGIRYSQHPNFSHWFLLGIAMTITVLLRQTFLPIIGLIGFWLWYAARGNRLKIIKGFTISILIVIAGIAPWTIRNYRVFHQFVLLNTNAGYAVYWANHPSLQIGDMQLLTTQEYLAMIPSELKGMDEASLEKELMRRSISSIISDPWHYIRLTLSRFLVQFKFWPSPDSSLMSNLSRVCSFGLFLPFICYGLWLVIFRSKRYKSVYDTNNRPDLSNWLRSPIALWLLFFIIYNLMHIATWASIRYRLPTDAVMIIFAAVGIVDLYQRIMVKFKLKTKLLSENVINR